MNEKIEFEIDEEKARIKSAAVRWGVHSKSIKAYLEKGDEVGKDPPLWAEDPEDFLEWYRIFYGREPSQKVRARAEVLRRDSGLSEVVEVVIDLGPVEVIEKALERLGLSLSLARVIEEEERAHASYRAAMDAGRNADALRKRWRDAGEMKRSLQKGDEAVAAALEILKSWVLKTWEPEERAVREGLSGANLGREAREELLGAKTPKEWERIWDRWILKGLAKGRKIEEVTL
jgi:hypothetical protein